MSERAAGGGAAGGECIRHSDGGVSEQFEGRQAHPVKCIRHSDGGVSEQCGMGSRADL